MPFFKKEQKAINDKWYPRTVTVGHPVEMDEVCNRIARTVHIEGLGSFYYGCVAEGTGKDTPEEVTADCIFFRDTAGAP